MALPQHLIGDLIKKKFIMNNVLIFLGVRTFHMHDSELQIQSSLFYFASQCFKKSSAYGGISSVNAIVMHPTILPLALTRRFNMTLVANDPSLWPLISLYRSGSYVVVASFAAVVYDWILTLGQEVELIWRQRWSLMTVLYLIIRYTGIIFVIIDTLWSLPSISHTDAGCGILDYTTNWTNVVIAAMLGVIVIARLYVMYHGSRKMLISLIVIFLAVNIGCGVITAIGGKYIVAEEFILSGTYQCITSYEGNVPLLIAMVWMLNTVWEVLTLCLSLWIAVKHIRNSRRLRPSTRLNIGDCFTMLIKSHVIYFTSFLAVSCFNLGGLSAAIADSGSIGAEIYYSLLKIFSAVQLFVLGPRLILSVREYNAKLVADSDVGTGMTSIAFQERVHVSTSSSV